MLIAVCLQFGLTTNEKVVSLGSWKQFGALLVFDGTYPPIF